MELLAFVDEIPGGALVGGGGIASALLFVGVQIGRLVGKAGQLVEQERERREKEDGHREKERAHWEREEAMLRHLMAGVPQQRPETGDHTPIVPIPVGE